MSDTHELPFYLLFGVLMAILLAGVFFMQLTKQREFEVSAQAQALADDLAKTCFSALSGQQPTLDLPLQLAGSSYEFEIDENRSTFIVRITGGTGAGESYWTIANVGLRVENANFAPGGRVYFMRSGDVMKVSTSPIEVVSPEISSPVLPTPPFYYFAKVNQQKAAAVVACYYFALDHYPEVENIDIRAYKWQENENSILTHVTTDGEFLCVVKASGCWHDEVADNWRVSNAWIVENVEEIGDDNEGFGNENWSVRNAASSGWLHSPQRLLNQLRQRTWQLSDNTPVVIPENTAWYAAAVTTNVGTYCTWRFEWWADNVDYVIYYQIMPWCWAENTPGFVFQSKPELEVVV